MVPEAGIEVFGVDVLADTRCAHYHSVLDIIAIRFRCCNRFYSCFECHASVAGHDAETWPIEEFGEKAILCGACAHLLTINEYMDSNSTCPNCRAAFNPGCTNHYHLYFQNPLS
jgi:uncharacterized CHY-type Zn-finger protein